MVISSTRSTTLRSTNSTNQSRNVRSPKTAPESQSYFADIRRPSPTEGRDRLALMAIGALGGAVGGFMGQSPVKSVLINSGVNAALTTTAVGLDLAINGAKAPYGKAGFLGAPYIGLATGIVGGVVGAGLSAAVGLHPAISGALCGTVTGFLASFPD